MRTSELELDEILDNAGFSGARGLILAACAETPTDRYHVDLQYGGFLDPEKGMDAVYEVAEVPQLYFKFLGEPNQHELRRQLRPRPSGTSAAQRLRAAR